MRPAGRMILRHRGHERAGTPTDLDHAGQIGDRRYVVRQGNVERLLKHRRDELQQLPVVEHGVQRRAAHHREWVRGKVERDLAPSFRADILTDPGCDACVVQQHRQRSQLCRGAAADMTQDKPFVGRRTHRAIGLQGGAQEYDGADDRRGIYSFEKPSIRIDRVDQAGNVARPADRVLPR